MLPFAIVSVIGLGICLCIGLVIASVVAIVIVVDFASDRGIAIVRVRAIDRLMTMIIVITLCLFVVIAPEPL